MCCMLLMFMVLQAASVSSDDDDEESIYQDIESIAEEPNYYTISTNTIRSMPSSGELVAPGNLPAPDAIYTEINRNRTRRNNPALAPEVYKSTPEIPKKLWQLQDQHALYANCEEAWEDLLSCEACMQQGTWMYG